MYVNSTQYKYKTDNQLMLMGGDFFYSNYTYSKMFFEMLSEIIKKSKNLDIQFATPAEYFQAVYESNNSFEVFQGDLFPLISSGNPYNKAWTGFFSTKPLLKKEANDLQTIVRAAEIMQSVVMNKPFIAYNLAVATHHDSITGTCKPWVSSDYLQLLESDKNLTYQALSESYNAALVDDGHETRIALPYKVLYLFNPLDWKVTKTMSFNSKFKYVKVLDGTGSVLEVQSVPWDDDFRFYFKYSLEAYSLKVVFVSELNNRCLGCSEPSEHSIDQHMSNKHIELAFKGGLLNKVKNSVAEHVLNTRLMNYTTLQSGGYTFCPFVIIM